MRPTDAEMLQARFWAKVQVTADADGCWLWTARARYSRGYGAFSAQQGKQTGAHRFMWELTQGPIPAGMFVLHHCDNPPCVRPDHLFLGTARDNAIDMARKRRTGRDAHPEAYSHLNGDGNPAARLTQTAVTEIRRRYAAGGILQRELAEEYGVQQTTVSSVILRKNWTFGL